MKTVICQHTVEHEGVGGKALAIGVNVLVAEAGIRAGIGEGIGVDAGAKRRELGKGASAERRVLNSRSVQNVAIGGIRSIELRGGGDIDAGGDGSRSHSDVQGCGPVSLNENVREVPSIEARSLNRDAVGPNRKSLKNIGADVR